MSFQQTLYKKRKSAFFIFPGDGLFPPPFRRQKPKTRLYRQNADCLSRMALNGPSFLFTAFADHKTFGGCANHTKQTRPMPFVVFIKFKWNSGPSCNTEAIAVDILHRLINQFRGKSPRIITAR